MIELITPPNREYDIVISEQGKSSYVCVWPLNMSGKSKSIDEPEPPSNIVSKHVSMGHVFNYLYKLFLSIFFNEFIFRGPKHI